MAVKDAKDALKWEKDLIKELVNALKDTLKKKPPSSDLQSSIAKAWKEGLERRLTTSEEFGDNYSDDKLVEVLEHESQLLDALVAVANMQENAAAKAWKSHFESDQKILVELLK